MCHRAAAGPRAPRELPIDALVRLLKEFIASKAWNDDHFSETEVYSLQV